MVPEEDEPFFFEFGANKSIPRRSWPVIMINRITEMRDNTLFRFP
jgi:hypothetical protein